MTCYVCNMRPGSSAYFGMCADCMDMVEQEVFNEGTADDENKGAK